LEEDERFKVREFLELHMQFGQRRIRIYFTDIAVYLLEYYTGYTMAYFTPAVLLKAPLTNAVAPWWRKTIDKMTDIREIMGRCHWQRRYGYDEIKEMWIESGEDRDKLYFTIERKNKEICTPGFGSGTDFLSFDKEKFEHFDEVLKRRMGETYTGTKVDLTL